MVSASEFVAPGSGTDEDIGTTAEGDEPMATGLGVAIAADESIVIYNNSEGSSWDELTVSRDTKSYTPF